MKTPLSEIDVSKQRLRELIAQHWKSNRVPVGEDTSALIRDLRSQLGGRILRITSGMPILTWEVPPGWEVKEAFLEGPDGRRIADFADNPLFLKSYSVPFKGTLSLQELLPHITSDAHRPEAIIYDYRAQYQYGTRTEWGFSLPHRVREQLIEGDYKVVIDSRFYSSTLDIWDLHLQGANKETIFFCAHSCHPALVNDGIACIAVLLELFRWLQTQPMLRYSYRLIVGPEYFAAAGFLDRVEDVKHLRYGLYLDMAGNGQPLGFSRSFNESSHVNEVMREALEELGADFHEFNYRQLWGNDEMFYDGPGFEIPTVCLGRLPFTAYHTDQDNLENCNFEQLVESTRLLARVVEIFESDTIPEKNFKGPLYLSKYGLYIDPKVNRKGARSLQQLQIFLNGKTSCLQIARKLGIPYSFVVDFVDQLEENDLLQSRPHARL